MFHIVAINGSKRIKIPKISPLADLFVRLVVVPFPLIHVLIFGIFMRLREYLLRIMGVPFHIEA